MRRKRTENVGLSSVVAGTSHTADANAPLAVDAPTAAEWLGIGERKCWSLISSGELVSFKVGRLRRVAVDEINAYIRRRQALSSAAA